MIRRKHSVLGACVLGIVAMVLLAGRVTVPPAPRAMSLGALPVQGGRADALRAGFLHCTEATRNKLRCRRGGVILAGLGPFTAAVDLLGAEGQGGFYQLTLWDDYDADAVDALGKHLKAQGWSLCRTGPNEYAGDQDIYTLAGQSVRFSIDISYWGKQRARILPELNQPTGHCWSH